MLYQTSLALPFCMPSILIALQMRLDGYVATKSHAYVADTNCNARQAGPTICHISGEALLMSACIQYEKACSLQMTLTRIHCWVQMYNAISNEAFKPGCQSFFWKRPSAVGLTVTRP